LLVASLLHGSTASAQGAPYTSDIPHAIHSSTKAIIGALIAIAHKDGLLDRLDHPMLDFSSGRDIADIAIDSVPGG
jgi:CubicO group peptidase (beta-lactamase class C family)